MEKWESVVIDYINGALNQEEQDHLLKTAETDEDVAALLAEYQDLDTLMCDDELMPSYNIDDRINELIINANDSSKGRIISMKTLMSIAAAVLIMMICWVVMPTDDVSETNMTNLDDSQSIVMAFNNNSVSSRIHAVNVSANMEEINDQVKNVLIKSLTEDNSPNVRLAAVESLSDRINDEWVRVHMIRALSVESDPFVQIALINALSTTRSGEAEQVIKNLITDETVPQFIKDEAQVGLLEFQNF